MVVRMARTLLSWELGGNYGHLVALRALARELKRQGHECVFAVRMLGAAQRFLEPQLGPLVQAPVRLTPGANRVRTQVSYASLLHNVGFNDPVELAGRIQAWRTLYRALETEHVFADHSPVALVAARTLGIPASCIGNGFTVPPLLAPFPSFRPRLNVPQEILLRNDAAVLKALNHALALLKLRPLPLLQDIFRGTGPALLTYAPLDHYEVARPERFRGMPDYSYGQRPQWPQGQGPKVFAYLRPGPALPLLLRALERSRARVLVRLAGAAPAAPPSSGRVALAREPVHFRAAAESCDAFVNDGAHSTVAEFLLAGKPGILVPDLQERAMTARRAASVGATLTVRPTAVMPIRRALERALEDPAPRKAAQAFAAQHARPERAEILPEVVAEIL
jgi:UDP:flavonoid glycosyltransferase YjiC (YdhE family)